MSITFKDLKELITGWINDNVEWIKQENEAFAIALDQQEYEIASCCTFRIQDAEYSQKQLSKILEHLEQLEHKDAK